MDSLTRAFAEYTTSLRYEELPADVVHEVKRLLLDTLACAVGGFHTDLGKIARSGARRARSEHLPAHVLGTRDVSTPELAAFANSCMVRALDFNDMVPGGHPSDALGAVLAVADARHASGCELIPAVVATYEVFNALSAAVKDQETGWDQGWAISLAATCGAARLLGLPLEPVAHAVAIAATAHVSTRQTRAGQLSMWKGAAAPYAASEAIRTTLLAAEGMTGPTRAFDGRHGVFEQLTGRFDLPPLGRGPGPYQIFRTRLKYWPVEYYTQSAVWLARELREWAAVDQIEAIEVESYWACWSEVGSEPEKWDPRTRETADHSLPYIMAVALRDGVVTPASFHPRAYLDPTLRPVMAKITVRENPAFTAAWPEKMTTQATAVRRGGERKTVRQDNPRGHRSNPMTDRDIEEKFGRLGEGLLTEEQLKAAIGACWALEREPDVAALLAHLIL